MSIIDEYLFYYKTKKKNASKETIRTKKQALEKLSYFLQNKTKHKSLKKATEKDMLNFFNDSYYVPSGSHNIIGINIIPFYRWLYNLDKHTRPKNMKWFETSSERTKRKNNDPHRKDKYLITTDEYNKMINYSKDFYGQNKAIWETYYLSGFRPEELPSMNIADVREDENNNVWVSCPKSKTYPREIPLPEYPENIIRYLGNHPQKDNKYAPLFFIVKGSTKFKRLPIDQIRDRFRKMRTNLKLKPTLTIKSFRKTRATILFSSEDPKVNNDTTIGKYMGWSPSTVIFRRQEYNLTNLDDLRKAICKKPMESKSYDTIITNLHKLENQYEPTIKEQQKEIINLKKTIKDMKKIQDTNREEFKTLKEKIIEFTEILDDWNKHRRNLFHPYATKDPSDVVYKFEKVTDKQLLKAIAERKDELIKFLKSKK